MEDVVMMAEVAEEEERGRQSDEGDVWEENRS